MKPTKGRPKGQLSCGSLADQIHRAKIGSIIWTDQNQKSVWSVSTKNKHRVKTAVYWAINTTSGKTIKITAITKLK